MNKTDSASVCTDSETAIHKLFAGIRNYGSRILLHRFRTRVSGIISTDSAFHKLFSPIQKLFPTNSETTFQSQPLAHCFRNYGSETFCLSSYSVVVRHTNAKLQNYFNGTPSPSHPAASQNSIAPGTFD